LLSKVLLAAVSRFYADHILQRNDSGSAASLAFTTDVEGGVMLSLMADDRLADALLIIEAMGNFFNVRNRFSSSWNRSVEQCHFPFALQ
jgi:hypothetical protein